MENPQERFKPKSNHNSVPHGRINNLLRDTRRKSSLESEGNSESTRELLSELKKGHESENNNLTNPKALERPNKSTNPTHQSSK